MRTFGTTLPVSIVALFVTTTVHAQTSPGGVSTAPSAAPVPSVPPPAPSQTAPADTATPPPAPPLVSADASETSSPPPTPVARPVKKQSPAPPLPTPDWGITPGPSIWGPATKSEPYIKRWYGWKTLIAVAGADVLYLVGQSSSTSVVEAATACIGIPVHLMAGPINHWAHGKVGTGFGVLGINVFAPLIGLLADNMVVAAIGFFAAPVLDIALFSTRDDKVRFPPPKGAAALLPSSLAIAPMIDANHQGFSIIGQF